MIFRRLNLFKFFTFMFILGLSPIIVHAGTAVSDSSSSDLGVLKQAIESTFKTQCSEIEEKQSGVYTLDLANCLPSRISNILGKHALIGGPNCYNFALYSLGIVDSLRPINSSEIENLIFSKENGVCSQIEDKTQKKKLGELISLEEEISDGDTRKIHAYIYLTEKYALTKNGPETDSPWQIATIDSILKTYPISKETRKMVRYKCHKPQVAAAKDLARLITTISEFSRFMSEIQIKTTPLEKLKLSISNLSKELSNINLQILIKNSSNLAVQMKLYELVSHFYTVKNFYYALSDERAKTFKAHAEMYIDILEKILNISENTYGINDVSSGEDGLEYGYCAERSEAPTICSFGSGH